MARIYLAELNARVLDPGVGKTGDPGNNAYEVAVLNGFVGTEEEWLASLEGDPGTSGSAATIAIGTVTTLGEGASATVENAGTETAAVLNFGIPRGIQGDAGANGTSVVDAGVEDPNDLTYLELSLIHI